MPRALITGGAGFVGSHLCDRLVRDGWTVVAVDSLLTGDDGNVSHLAGDPLFSLEREDVSQGLSADGAFDLVAHLASPASPPDYLAHPLETLAVGAEGTRRALEFARSREAVFLLSSTSEVYGDPLVHPQPENYWGNVNPIGPRSVYDEAKRFAEALASAHARTLGTRVRIARIFNTYGPRMRRNDGRAVPQFIDEALGGRPLTVHGDGSQTRSFCYVDDLVEGLVRLADSDVEGPVNLGNPTEMSVLDLAEKVCDLAGVPRRIEMSERPVDDPQVRCPDIARAMSLLGWEPKIGLDQGLRETIAWARGTWYPA
jgi:dTDP-glucose 4,6-dehydratase